MSTASESSTKLRDSSFSSYLDGVEETFVLELRASKRDNHAYNLGRTIRTTEDREIDVFDAKKYFNEGTANYNSPIQVGNRDESKKDDPIQVLLPVTKDPDQVAAATPSVRSESSSWNSGSGMLHCGPKNQKAKKMKRKSFLANIGCSCSCSDKNSVETGDFDRDINCSIKSGSNLVKTCSDPYSVKIKSLSLEHDSRAKFPESEMKEQGHFSFPVFNSKAGNQAAARIMQTQAEELDDAPKRKSLDVFASPILGRGKNSLSLDKKLSMLTWDALVPGGVTEEIKNIPPICSDLNNDSDSDSDDSDDLFEIQSLSKGNSFLSRQASGGLSGCITPRNCYAPSEASIEWSVVTASAADFSVFSDFEELRSTTATATSTATTSTVTVTPNHPRKPCPNPRNSPLKQVPKRRTGILSGCKSEKAVRVAGDAHKSHDHKGTSNTRNPLKSDTSSKVPGFDPRKRQQSFEACVVSQPHAGAAAHLLYT
ncbi:protein PHYTOCHROME KINASE SUBSTRATE 1-like [Henckelia pumila]|uniref:protein PHYTOCHROME KINASE SUBSTRATE 1-like n=1 Tax=Henckelia pumila TaxID=405737 RepID=UPI003C6E3820